MIRLLYAVQSTRKTFLQSLGFATTLQTAEEAGRDLTSSESVPLTKNTLHELNLRRLIMIGDEKSGKSSTLERIIGIDCLPRDQDICTRQPVALQLFYDENFAADSPRFKVTIPGNDPIISTDSMVLDAQRVKNIIAQRNEEIKASGVGIVFNSEIIVEIRSDGVPTLELVDLPGLREAIDIREPVNLPELTTLCCKKYMEDERTGAVVCVVDATLGNLNTSKSIKMVQQSSERLKNNTIGVFAKSDLAVDPLWRRKLGKQSSLWRLEEYMSGMEETFNDFKYGFVALINRETGLTEEYVKTLGEQLDEEYNYFYEQLVIRPDSKGTEYLRDDSMFFGRSIDPFDEEMIVINDRGKHSLGLSALLQKMNSVICGQLATDWLPAKLAEYKLKILDLENKLTNLGLPPDQLTLLQLIQRICALLEETYFSESYIEGVMVPSIEISLQNELNRYAQPANTSILKYIQQKEHVSASVLNHMDVVVSMILNEMTLRFTKCFEEDETGDIRLNRFSTLRDALLHSMRVLFQENVNRFRAETNKFIEQYFVSCTGNNYDLKHIVAGIKEIAVKHLLGKVLSNGDILFPFILNCFPMSQEELLLQPAPTESSAALRKELLDKIANVNRATMKLQDIK